MPGPFPGVDPYLEAPARWRGFHNNLIAFITGALNAVLPPGFVAETDERVYIMPQDRYGFPDVAVMRRTQNPPARSTGNVAVLEPTEPDGCLVAFPEPQREAFVEIRPTDGSDKVVTVIEVLSPANKASGSVGREEYLRKQHDILQSDTNLLEIDLLRQGQPTIAAAVEPERQRAGGYGAISLHRYAERHSYYYWLVMLRRPLPVVPIPLVGELPDVALDLQACYTRAYDNGAYDRLIDYTNPPPVRLAEEDLAWLRASWDVRETAY